MAETAIPVDIRSPGQVLACMGIFEAACILTSAKTAYFDWKSVPEFRINSESPDNPVETVLRFIATAAISEIEPDRGNPEFDGFPAKSPEKMALPISLQDPSGMRVFMDHWTDQTRKDSFKLYSGNRTAAGIASSMQGYIRILLDRDCDALVRRPMDVLIPMGGSFNFDPRGAWNAMDTGYSPNRHSQDVAASPVVELLAAWGLQNTRLGYIDRWNRSYAIWSFPLPLMLARVALSGAFPVADERHFHFELQTSGKNKIISYAEEVPET
jgi:CRISPR-associated protein Csx14